MTIWLLGTLLFGSVPAVVLSAAIFFQLIWLDFFYVGTFVPPQGLAAYLAFLPPALCFNLQTPREAVLLLIFCLPLARAAAWLEAVRRDKRGDKNYLALMNSIDAGGDVAGTLRRVILAELLRRALADFLLCACGAALVCALVWFLGVYLANWPVAKTLHSPFAVWLGFTSDSPGAGWGLLWAFAAVGGLLSLRIRNAFISFTAGALLLGAVVYLTALLPG